MTHRPIVVRDAVPSDATALAAFAARTFVDTYADDNPPGLVEAHAREVFGPAQQAAEIADPTADVILAEEGSVLLGYVLLADRPTPDVVSARSPLALQRLYVDAPAKGRGVGTALVSEAIRRAAALGHDVLWLTVWPRNPRAIAAYERWGFDDVGTTVFDMAGDRQVDRVMVRSTVDPLPERATRGGAPAPRRASNRQAPFHEESAMATDTWNIGDATIELVVGDIAAQPDVDAVVNAANAQLEPGGGVAGAIHRAAGRGLAAECRPLAPIEVTQAVVTGGHDLPTPHVIHALGPVHGRDEPSDVLLATTYENVLKAAEREEYRAIATPAISTGAFGFPADAAARIALRTVGGVLPRVDHLRHVRFVLFDDDALSTHRDALAAVRAERGD